MALVLVISMAKVTEINAAAKPKLSKTKATVVAGESTTLTVKNLSGGVL
jgi:hypothetical protein